MFDGLEQRAIKWARFDKHLSLVCLRKQVGGWFECDVLGVTKARYWHEIEIKTSRGDYRRDFEKNFWGGLKKHDVMRLVLERKEPDFDSGDRISDRVSRGYWGKKTVPNYFWFMMPDKLASQITVPPHAGLLVLKGGKYPWVKIEKRAPLLHKDKVTDAFIDSIVRAFEYRFYSLMEMVDDLHKELERLKSNGEEKESLEKRLYKALDCAEAEAQSERADGHDGTAGRSGSEHACGSQEAEESGEETCEGGGENVVERRYTTADLRADAGYAACEETAGEGGGSAETSRGPCQADTT
jgi:hypothetical protein